MFRLTGSESSARAMVGRAVVTTVESSICIKSAQPTIKGRTRRACGETAGVAALGGVFGLGVDIE